MSDHIDVPYNELAPDTLTRIIEEFITREGTDYGHETYSIEEKVAQVRKLLEQRRIKITFDPDSESCTIVTS